MGSIPNLPKIKYDAEVIILGLGSVGSFALDYLAKKGISVIGLERFSRLHTRGSNHGKSRVFRHAYFEHANYVPLLLDATLRFQDLQMETKVPIINQCGVLILSEKESLSTQKNIAELAFASAQKYSIPVEKLNSQQIKTRFPQFNITDTTQGLWEPGGGFVRPENSICAAQSRAEKNGATIIPHAKVSSFVENKGIADDYVEVNYINSQSECKVLRSKSLIMAAGAYTSNLVPSLKPYLKVTRQRQAWLEPKEPKMARPDQLPCWFVDRGENFPLYGIPADPDKDEVDIDGNLFPSSTSTLLFKVAIHGGGPEVDPETYSQTFTKQDDADLIQVAKDALPNLPATYSHGMACLYTETPDEHFIVDRVPNTRKSWVVAGLSGHGFKLAPALGKVVGDLAIDGKTNLEVGFLGLSRLQKE